MLNREFFILYFFPLLGTIIGWSLNEFTRYLNIKRDNKKNLNIVLFNLLDGYLLYYSYNIVLYIQILFNEFEKNIDIPLDDDEMLNLKMSMIYDFHKMHSSYFEEKFNDLELVFNKSIDSLALISPTRAYYLKGSMSLFSDLKKLDNSIEYYKNNYNDEDLSKFLEKISKENNNIHYLRLLKDLEKDILNISKDISYITYFKSKSILKNIKKDFENRIKESARLIISNFDNN